MLLVDAIGYEIPHLVGKSGWEGHRLWKVRSRCHGEDAKR